MEVNDLQRQILSFMLFWVRNNKTPIPRQEIVASMQEKGIKSFTVTNCLETLLKNGYVRRATTVSRKTSYVLLRSI